MHATRSNIVDPTNVYITMFEREAGALDHVSSVPFKTANLKLRNLRF